MSKIIERRSNIKEKILKGVDLISDPIRQTMSPFGENVLFEDGFGNHTHTNDGATIARFIEDDDPIVNQTIAVIKTSSLKTNKEAGDGTSSTVLLSGILIKEGMKLIDQGIHPRTIKEEYEKFGETIKASLEKETKKVNGDEDIKRIALVSSSNDEEISNNVVKIMNIIGTDGQAFFEVSDNTETKIIEDTGFIMSNGLFSVDFSENNSFQAKQEKVPTLITNKRLYYREEAENILSTLVSNGYRNAVIVAADFIGDAIEWFKENHKRRNVNLILIKEQDLETLEDLAIYLGGEVITDTSGFLDELTLDHFVEAEMVFSNRVKSIISRDKNEININVSKRVADLKKEMEDVNDKDSSNYKKLSARVASLTRGMVKVKVGGRTPIEVNEKLYRYEDAINACNRAMLDGYVIGGGMSLFNAFNSINQKKLDPLFISTFEKFSTAITRQIAENCGASPEVVIDRIREAQEETSKDWGYNALLGKVSNLLEDGVIEPYRVAQQVVDNSISIANIILTSGYRVVNKLEEDNNNK